MAQLFIKHSRAVLTLGPDGSSGKESQPILSEFAAIFYETSVNLGTWQPEQFGRGEERSAAIQAEWRNFLFKQP
jgi:hypothetical protein